MKKQMVGSGLLLACALLTTVARATIITDYDRHANFSN